MSDGPIPVGKGRLLVFVGFRHPVIIRQVSFSVASSFFAWVERSHTEYNTIQYNTIQYSFISAQHICSVHVMSNIVVEIYINAGLGDSY